MADLRVPCSTPYKLTAVAKGDETVLLKVGASNTLKGVAGKLLDVLQEPVRFLHYLATRTTTAPAASHLPTLINDTVAL
jgi:hypothetical protein